MIGLFNQPDLVIDFTHHSHVLVRCCVDPGGNKQGLRRI